MCSTERHSQNEPSCKNGMAGHPATRRVSALFGDEEILSAKVKELGGKEKHQSRQHSGCCPAVEAASIAIARLQGQVSELASQGIAVSQHHSCMAKTQGNSVQPCSSSHAQRYMG